MQRLDSKEIVYKKYKHSGEYWMGSIPNHWEIKKLKHIFKEKKKVSNPLLPCGSISFGEVIYKDDDKVPLSTKASYQEVQAGEYLVNPLNLNYDLISLRIALSKIDVVVSSGYIVLKNIIHLDKSYFNYLLHRYDVSYMKLLGSGVRQTISFNHIANSLLAYPPLHEQTRIANYLDDKCAKIDKAIAQKERLIELLEERKQIIIQNAVTKGLPREERIKAGLPPDVKMKDSGIDWIGEIPEDWEVKRLKYVIKVKGGYAFDSGDYKEDGVQVIKIANTYMNKLALDRQPTFVDKSHIVSHSDFLIETGDIIMSLTGTLGKKDYAYAILIDSDRKFMLNQRVAKISSINSVNENYLLNVFHSNFFLDQIYKLPSGTKQANLSNGNILNSLVIYPMNETERNTIVDYLDYQNRVIKKSIDLTILSISKLKEYKATLIDSLVTGKVRVMEDGTLDKSFTESQNS